MKTINIIYWISTVLICLAMGASGVMNAIAAPETVKIMQQIGYPPYFSVFIGVAKILGAIAILVPGFNKLKEWAYAGFTFDLIGALYSVKASGAKMSDLAIFPVFFIVLAVSYIYFHKRLAAKKSA